jgi:ankyrin repeat protein
VSKAASVLRIFWSRQTGSEPNDEAIASLMANDWQCFRELRSLGRISGPMGRAIEDDDLDAFQASLPRGFSPDMTIQVTPFCVGFRAVAGSCSFISVLAYAAWRGAAKIAGHLWINEARVTYQVGRAAIAGGCPGIVQLIHQRRSPYDGIGDDIDWKETPFPPQFPHRSSFSWILYALSFSRTNISRWLRKTTKPAPDAVCSAFHAARTTIITSNNGEALLKCLRLGCTVADLAPALTQLLPWGPMTLLRFVNTWSPAPLTEALNDDKHPDSATHSWCPPLVAAVRSGQLSALELLSSLRQTFPPQTVRWAIGTAFNCGYVDLAAWLLSRFEWATERLAVRSILWEGAPRGTTEAAALLLPFMEELGDIRTFIVFAIQTGNIELTKYWIEWQQQHRPLPLDQFALMSIRVGDLEIARLLGDPSREFSAVIVSTAAKLGFIRGVQYGLNYLSGTDMRALFDHCNSSKKHQLDLRIASLFFDRMPARDALVPAVKLGDIARVKRILATGNFHDIVTADGTPLGAAVAADDDALVELLLSVPGIDPMMPNLNGESPFVLACKYAGWSVWARIADFLGEKLAEDPDDVNAGFFWACSRRDIDFELTLRHFFRRFENHLDANFHVGSDSPITLACARKHAPLLRWLFTFPGVDVNNRDGTGSTPAILAARAGWREGINILLADSRTDFDLVNIEGESALSAACHGQRIHIARDLFDSNRINLRLLGARIVSRLHLRLK